MHRLMVGREFLSQERVVLPKAVDRHLRALRPRPGEDVELFDGRGNYRRYVYDGDLAAVAPASFEPKPESELRLFACITKGSRWDWTLEKAVELGVTGIVPVISERTIVRIPAGERAEKRARHLRIVESAVVQSGRRWMPEVSEAVDFPQALGLAAETLCFAGALTDPPSPGIMDALRRHGFPGGAEEKPPLSTFIGPEGDFTPEELERLLATAVPVSFGPAVLRAETAAIFALSVLSAATRLQ